MAAVVADTPAESDALSQVARALAVTGPDVPGALTLLVDGTLNLMLAEGAMLARVEGNQFRVEAATGSLTPMVGFEAPLAPSLAGEALARGQALALTDAAADARLAFHFLAPFTPHQVAIAPLVAGRVPQGFLLALNSRRSGFTSRDVATLQRLADYAAIALTQADTARRAEATAADVATLSRAVHALNQSLELEPVVALLAQYAAEFTGARGARVALLENTGLAIVASAGDIEDCVGRTARSGRHFAQEAIRQLQAVQTADLRDYADEWRRPRPAASLDPNGGVAAEDEGRANGLAVPLIIGGRAIGAITVFGNELRDFDARDASVLQGLANHGAAAVENARLYRASAYMARHANALAAAARALAASTTPEAVMTGISRVACTALGADGFSLFLVNTSTRRVELGHAEGAGAGVINWTANRFWSMPVGQVAISGVPLYAADVGGLFQQLRPNEVAAYRAEKILSLAILPLPNDGGQQGVLVLRFTVRRRFDDPERRLLEDFATQVAVAIRNAQLVGAERASRDREGALKESMHQTEKLAALGELVAGVAHELNNPLAGISTFAQLLLEETLTDEQRESVREIKREADRAGGVIRELLTFSRKTGPKVAAVDLNALVGQTLRLRAYSLQTAGVEIQVECDPDPPLAIGDDQRLQQVLLNLVVNAEYAMHRSDRRVLTVRTGRRTVNGTPQVFVDVLDTGGGMSAELISRIFEPFFTTKPAGVGTGLGLSVSHTIVQGHGGTIDVSSVPGNGSTFTVALPAYMGKPTGPASIATATTDAQAPAQAASTDADHGGQGLPDEARHRPYTPLPATADTPPFPATPTTAADSNVGHLSPPSAPSPHVD